MATTTNRQMYCHSLLVPLPPGTGAPDVRRHLAAALVVWTPAHPLPLWETRAASRNGRAAREAARPIAAGRFPIRIVLVSYCDGGADLVVVADRRAVPRPMLEGVADALLGAEPPDLALDLAFDGGLEPALAPQWGLGDPARTGTVGVRAVAAPRHPDPAGLVLAAVALTLARYAGETAVTIGTLGEGGDQAYTCGGLSDDEPAAGLLARATAAAAETVAAGAPRPPVGLLAWDADGRDYRPALAPPWPMTFEVVRRPGGVAEVACRFDEGAVAAEVAEGYCASVALAAARLCDAATVADVPLVDPDRIGEILALGDARHHGDTAALINQRFEAMARRRPDAVAIVDDTGELTYRQVDERATALAAGLRAAGVATGGLVGVCLDRDAWLVVALLGVLKAGCAYVPMDLAYPAERLRYIAGDAGVGLVIGDPGTFPAEPGVRVVAPAELAATGGAATPAETPPRKSDDPAYVIYTSGSTGRPKGVVVPHRNVTALVHATADDFGLSPADAWSLFHSSAFDFSVWEMWGCLLTGARLVIVPYWVSRDAEEFQRLLADRRVTVLNQTPSAFAQLARADRFAPAGRELPVRLLLFGGEPLDVRLLADWFPRHPHSHCRVVNMYGITETTVHVTARTVTPADVAAGSRSVGRALPGWSVSVRDPAGRPLPPGVAGEIYVGGAGVADGYLGRPDLTAQRFVVDPYTGRRVYRSGDRGRLRPDGGLDHLGRLDSQVKIRGHRVELDEIRAVLAADPDVRAAAVVVTEITPGDPTSARIDAYVTLARPANGRRILAGARRILPGYMVPATLTELPEIPLTSNGKPDLARLQALGRTAAPGPGAAPAGPEATIEPGRPGGVAGTVLRVWGRCLGVEVTAEDNFFELGGNSLLVVRLLALLRDEGLPRVAPRDFYANSTAAGFIAHLERTMTG